MTLTNPVRPALTNALSAVRRSTTGTSRGQDDHPHRSWPPATVIAALVVLALLLVAAVAPNLLAPYDPLAVDLDATLQPPSWAHPFGTDLSGRDLLSRVIAGTRQSLIIGLGAVALASVLAVLLGIAAGLSGRVAQALAIDPRAEVVA